MRFSWLPVVLITLCNSCAKDKEILTGGIMGRISVFDESYSSQQDASGVKVVLFKDTTHLSTMVTDVHGIFLFENIAYGRYNIKISKEGYSGVMVSTYIYHVGGYSPTLTYGAVYPIPTFNLTIDSAKVFLPENEAKIYLKINGDTLSPYNGYPIIGYCSNSPDVSCDNYISITRGIIKQRDKYNAIPLYGLINYFDPKFKTLQSETIYIRLYPLAFGQDVFNVNPQALGKPSNVISLTWQ